MHDQKPYISICLQKNDPDRFLLSMFAPAAQREDLWALIAFNHEIAKTRDVVSEPQLGLIRLQWWREALAAIYQKTPVPEHEVMMALAAAIDRHNLPLALFEEMLAARVLEMTESDFVTLDAFYDYAAATAEPLLKLMLLVQGAQPDSEPVYALALNYALVGLVRAIPFAAAQGRCLIPADVLNRHGLERMQVMSGQAPIEGLSAAVQEILSAFVVKLHGDVRMLRGLQALSLIYMRQLRACRYNPFDPALARPPMMKALRILMKVYAPV
jgi:NADH dehydrogenase [ubiquinone] 1 alpha subcomplex assembly factor 6